MVYNTIKLQELHSILIITLLNTIEIVIVLTFLTLLLLWVVISFHGVRK